MPETVWAIMLGVIIISIVVDDEPVVAVFADYERAEEELAKFKHKNGRIVVPLEVIR